MSFVARLAHRNGIATVREFCFDLGLSMRRLADGDVAQVTRLAEIAGTDVEALLRESRKREGTIYRIRGQILTNASLMRPHFRACPVCMAEDIRKSSGLRGHPLIHYRTIWSILHIRTCVEHAAGLINIYSEGRENVHDFPQSFIRCLDKDSQKLSRRTDRFATSFERYLIRRLNAPEENLWLDQMPFYAAAKTCEVLGIVKAFGRDQNSRYLTNTEWTHAGEQGFEIASGGADGIHQFLIGLWRDFPGPRGTPAGPKAWFGRLYHWLEYETKDPAYDPVRAVIVEAIANEIPFHPNEILFGKNLPYRKIHSVGTASHETRISEGRLRIALERAGHIGPEHVKHVAHDIHFDAVAAAPLLDRLSSALSAKATSDILGIKGDTLRLLVGAGFLSPIDKYQSATVASVFSADDVAAFMGMLRDRAEPIQEMPKTAADIVSAVSRTHSSLVDIVGLILSGKLSWIGCRSDVQGIRSIIVDVAELRERLRRGFFRGLTRRQVACELKISTSCARKLVEKEILPSIRQRHPTTRHHLAVVDSRHCREFNLMYIKIYDAAKLLRTSLAKTRHTLAVDGITPKLVKAEYGMDFYLRAEVSEFAEK
ncbi:TniQ protein [Methylobacterium sp. 13MFTsu3.1M2]|nr:TniQ protein [Methylobacterium sp. 13MFTsu3.1M2]